MMDINDTLEEVINITNRPDKVSESISAINQAISRCTLKASFARDLIETTLTIDGTKYGDTIQFDRVSPDPVVTRFRKFKYVKAYGVKGYLDPIGADKIFTPGSYTQKNVYYVGGNNLTYILANLAPTLEIGYYQYPLILDVITNKNHWMLDLMPWAIIDLAASRIFRSIGDDKSATTYMGTGNELFVIGRKDFEDSILVR